jgi:hypothetical protein
VPAVSPQAASGRLAALSGTADILRLIKQAQGRSGFELFSSARKSFSSARQRTKILFSFNKSLLT